MNTKYIPLLFALCSALMGSEPDNKPGCPIRPLAQDYVVVDKSPNPETISLYTPSILSLGNGRLLAANERGGAWRREGNPGAIIYSSDDAGQTWTERGSGNMTHGRLFKAGDAVYYLGHTGNREKSMLYIMRSIDKGNTWSKQVPITEGRAWKGTVDGGQVWHGSATNVLHAKGNVYMVIERRVHGDIKTWDPGDLAPILMRAKESDDLTKPESWTYSNAIAFSDIAPGYRDNKTPFVGFGIPFFTQKFPNRNELAHRRGMYPIGWLEGNVVQITDPTHFWYDPSGNTFHLFMRAHTGGVGYAAIAKVRENPDGTMTTSLVQAPSGEVMLFLPLPGGHMRFHVVYDEQSKLYWLLSSQSTNSMTKLEDMPPERYDLPNNERQRMVLHFSKNMVDWCFAGVVAIAPSDRSSRHYASMDIDGDDLVILSRSGDDNAESAHNGNLITFHRVKNFRKLVY